MIDAVIYAHQGGWDEILLVLVPVAAIVALLVLAKIRAERAAEHLAEDAGSASEDPPAPPR